MKKVEFFQNQSNQNDKASSYSIPKCLVGQIQVQRLTLAAPTNKKPNHT